MTTRVVEFALAGVAATATATPVRTYGPTDRFAWFMGSAARLANGNVLIGWSADQTAMASETDASGDTIWSLADEQAPVGGVQPSGAYISYRAALVPERDGFDPQVSLDGPQEGISVAQGGNVPVTFSCQDRGGSTLQTCDGPAGQRLDTSTVGRHAWSVTARDGSGRRTTVTRSYTVTTATTTPAPPPTIGGPRPDLAVRTLRGSWVGAGKYAPAPQTASVDLRRGPSVRVLRVRLTNTGTTSGRFRLRAPTRLGRGALELSYRSRGEVRTRAISRGWRTPSLSPGRSLRVRVLVTVRRAGSLGWRLPVRATGRGQSDRVVVVPHRHVM